MILLPSRFGRLPRGFRAIARMVEGALAAAAATEGGRRPSPASLEALGIDPEAFRRIGRF